MTLKAQPTKHKEFILAVENSYFLEHLVNNKLVEADGETFRQVVPYDFKQFTDEVLPYLHISQRAGQEVDYTLRQLLPYLILTQKQADGSVKYANYWRTKFSGEEKLHLGRSVGFGGHIDWSDLVPVAPDQVGSIDLYKTIQESLDREGNEELFVTFTDPTGAVHRIAAHQWLLNFRVAYLILSKDEKVGRFHVGLVVEAEVHPDLKIASEEDAIDMDELATHEELLADPELEDWSRLFLNFKHGDQTDYNPVLGLIKRRTPVDDLIDQIGGETFQQIEALMHELRAAPTQERSQELREKLEAFGFVTLVDAPDGVRWGFNQQAFEAMKADKASAAQGRISAAELAKIRETAPAEWVEGKLNELAAARRDGHDGIADTILTILAAHHIVVEEAPEGTKWIYDDSLPAQEPTTLGETLSKLGFASEESGKQIDAAEANSSDEQAAVEQPQAEVETTTASASESAADSSSDSSTDSSSTSAD